MEQVQKQCVLSKATICLIHLDVCSYITGYPQCQVQGTKPPTYHHTSNLYERQQKDAINSQQTGMTDLVQTLNKITLFLLEASVWQGQGQLRVCSPALPWTSHGPLCIYFVPHLLHLYNGEESTHLTGCDGNK